MNSTFIPSMVIAFKLAYKSKIISTMSYFVIALIVIVLMAVEFSARQLSTVSLDVGISMIRLTLPFIAIVLAQELFSKEFDKKYTLTSLTFPCTRSTWLLSRITAIFLMCAGLLVVMSILLADYFLCRWHISASNTYRFRYPLFYDFGFRCFGLACDSSNRIFSGGKLGNAQFRSDWYLWIHPYCPKLHTNH